MTDLTEEVALAVSFAEVPSGTTVHIRAILDGCDLALERAITVGPDGAAVAKIAPGLPNVSTILRVVCDDREHVCPFSTIPLPFFKSTLAEIASAKMPIGSRFSFDLAVHSCAPIGTPPRFAPDDEIPYLTPPDPRRALHLSPGTLTCIAGHSKDESWPLGHIETIIGSHRIADVRLNDDDVKPIHARIEHWTGAYWIFPADGPVTVDGEACGRACLTTGAAIGIGKATLEFVRETPPTAPDYSPQQQTNRLVLAFSFSDACPRPLWPGGVRLGSNLTPWRQDPAALPLPRPARLSIWAKNAPRSPDLVPVRMLEQLEPLFAGQSQGAELMITQNGLQFTAQTTRFSLEQFGVWASLLPQLATILRGTLVK